jgi:inosine-uridine nucleoside N-ribohydrolase
MTAVILDTDIGGDIDDTWALAMLLQCPELDLRLVVSATGDTTYRAQVAAGILAAAGRADVPIGIGLPTEWSAEGRPQGRFADEFDLDRHPGGIHEDGVAALVDCVMSSTDPMTIVAIGPTTNVAAALEREPAIATRARLVGMHGSVRVGYFGRPGPDPEYNVAADVASCRTVFGAGWDVTITPLDTCGSVYLHGDRYARVRQTTSPTTKAVLRNYAEWCETAEAAGGEVPEMFADNELFRLLSAPGAFERNTSVLFDTVAVYLAYDESLVEIERLPIAIADDGTFVVEPGAPEVRVATAWRDADAFLDHLVERLV